MKKLLGLFCVMLLIFVVSGPIWATGNDGDFPGGGNVQGVFPGDGQMEGAFPSSENGAHAPEPATLILLGTGLVGLAVYGRKRFNR